MDDLRRRTWAEVSLTNIERNFKSIKAHMPDGCRFLGVVKADAYGHGAVPVARRLIEAGVEYFAVSCFEEAAELREADIHQPVLILGITSPELAVRLSELNITQTIADIEHARAYSKLMTENSRSLKVHLKIETGMGRLGFHSMRDCHKSELLEIMKLPGLVFEGIFTHFCVSDERDSDFTNEQFGRFSLLVSKLEESADHRFPIKHCANSGAVVNYNETFLDMVRPGIALYGMYPGADRGEIDLVPAMELKSRVAAITDHLAGDTISYGRTFTATDRVRIAVLPIGYADGLHRVLSNKIDVLIRGRRAKLVGRICMDMCMVDVTHIPDCRAGDVATIFGRDGEEFIPVEEQAEKAGTISYEMVCAVSKRVPRVYI